MGTSLYLFSMCRALAHFVACDPSGSVAADNCMSEALLRDREALIRRRLYSTCVAAYQASAAACMCCRSPVTPHLLGA